MDHTWVPFFQVDAFTKKPFRGNPAAVCLMPCDLDDALYLSIAREMNLSETAFVEPLEPGVSYRLRWFTPALEVPLCGHATLATAHVLFNHLGTKGRQVSFQTRSGVLMAEWTEGGIRLDFPRNDSAKVEPPEPLLRALNLSSWREVQFSASTAKLLICLEKEAQVRGLRPDFAALVAAENKLGVRGTIVTARGSGPYDFVSRYFAPWVGIDEDPVTGSAHTVLTPYWADRLGKRRMLAYQASKRGGELQLELGEDRVYITGGAVTVIEGRLRY